MLESVRGRAAEAIAWGARPSHGDALARLIALGAAAYFARLLGAEGYGVIAFAVRITLYLQQIVDYGVTRRVMSSDYADPRLRPR